MKTETGIKLYRRLNEGITGGGTDELMQSWRTAGPRNLLAAIRSMRQEQHENVEGYGDIGAGTVWLVVDGWTLYGSAENNIADWSDQDYGDTTQMGAARRCLAEQARLIARTPAQVEFDRLDAIADREEANLCLHVDGPEEQEAYYQNIAARSRAAADAAIAKAEEGS